MARFESPYADKIRKIAAEHGWTETDSPNPSMMTFTRGKGKERQGIEVWPTRMTVATMLWHPKHKKRTKLYRKHVEFRVLRKLFKNPRQHTTGGYMRRDSAQAGKVTKLRG